MTGRRGALVTGAGRGLGKGIAAMLASRGFHVMVTDLDGRSAATAAADIGHGAISAELDVRDHEQVEHLRDFLIEQVDTLSVWVNNAGVLLTGPAWEQTPEQRRLHLDVNALGTINGTVAAIAAMREQGGHIVNIASLAGITPVPGEAIYAASKHAVIGFSTSTASDLKLAGIDNVRISCLCPDGIWTPMLHDKLADPQAALSFSGRLLEPGEVVRAVGRALDSPRPVITLPAWRGAMARFGAAFPRLGTAALPLLTAHGRRKQTAVLRAEKSTQR